MATITMGDGTRIYYKDRGQRNAHPIRFHHGWPLGADDQVVPIDASARTSIKLLPNSSLKTCPGLSQGRFAIHPEVINGDLLAFVQA